MSTAWIKHEGLGAVSEVPASSLPQWRQSGWDLMTKEELADKAKADAAEVAAAVKWAEEIKAQGQALTLGLPAPAPVAPAGNDEGAPPRRTKKETG
jgi:hypothetical protein